MILRLGLLFSVIPSEARNLSWFDPGKPAERKEPWNATSKETLTN